MVGLFDWLSDAMGSGANPMGGGLVGNVDQMGNATGGSGPLPTPSPAATRAMPPVQPMDPTPSPPQPIPDMSGNMGKPIDMSTQPDPAAGFGGARMPPQPPYPPGGDPMGAGGTSPNDPRLPVPMPQPRPPGAGAPPPPPIPPPSGGMPGAPPAGPTGPPLSIAPPIAPEQPGAPQGGPISRALGLDPNRAKSMVSGLAAGLTAAGNSAGKSPFQALTSGAGASLEGSDKATDKTYDQKIKYLQAAVAAQSAGDKAAYNKNYAAYLAGKLKADTEKAASDGTGKKGAWNKPDSQKFIDAQHALSKDPEVHASQKLLEQASKTMEPAEIAKAQAAHSALIKDKEAKYLAGVGLDPQKLNDLVKNPPGTPQNPHVVTSQSDFDTYVKPGQAYRNPRDGKVYIRKGGTDAKAGDSGAAPTSPPAAPGPPPSPMGGNAASPDDEE